MTSTQTFAGKNFDSACAKKLTKAQAQEEADTIAEMLIKTLVSAEKKSLRSKNHRLLTEEEINGVLGELMKGQSLAKLGFKSLSEWRAYAISSENGDLRELAMNGVLSALKTVAKETDIPETDEALFVALALTLKTTQSEIDNFFGKGQGALFKSTSEMIKLAQEKFPNDFAKILDLRFFGEEYTNKMREAVRNAPKVLVVRLNEGQDIKAVNEAITLAKAFGKNIPIIVCPAFGEVGLINTSKRFQDLASHPNVFFFVDRTMSLDGRTVIANIGFHSKRVNPLPPWLDNLFNPDQTVVVPHGMIFSRTRYYLDDFAKGTVITTGTLSNPEFNGPRRMSMATDDHASLAMNDRLGLLILDRQYPQIPAFESLGGASEFVPRRAILTKERYGNPAGLFDLGKIYTHDGKVVQIPAYPGVILGDLHLGVTDPLALNGVLNSFKSQGILKPNPNFGKKAGELELTAGPVGLGVIMLHDIPENTPFSHWILEQVVSRAIADEKGALDITNYFQFIAAWITQLSKMLPDTVFGITIDNHGFEWIVKTLQNRDMLRTRPKELTLILDLILSAIKDGANPYERILQRFGVNTDKVHFLGTQDSLRIGIDPKRPSKFSILNGANVGEHGQHGKNGARFSMSITDANRAYGESAEGHHHSTSESYGSKRVGTLTGKQGWHTGASNSDASMIYVYSEDVMQILRASKSGEFEPNGKVVQNPEDFFPSAEYPIITKRERGGETIDNYSGVRVQNDRR